MAYGVLMTKSRKILILGASGMLGHVLFTELQKQHNVFGTVRSKLNLPFSNDRGLIPDINIEDLSGLEHIIKILSPDIVINCVGIIKQLQESKNKIVSIEINSLFPHKLAEICERNQARVIHFSTDCVFTGDKGNYNESDLADARDTYGLTKYMGEIDYPHSLTLRTSIIGHELNSSVSLLDWFLSQDKACNGFTKAIFSGFPTITVAKFLNNYVFPNDDLHGIYNFSSSPINKFELLEKVKKQYGKNIQINPSEQLKIDRSLDSTKLNVLTGFNPPSWDEMILDMHHHFKSSNLYSRRRY
jgi:dTDP-4-dehydrorhamnose reductase